MLVNKPGTVVKIHDEINGIITAVNIRGENMISYEVTFVNGGTTETKWYYDYELSVQNPGVSSKIKVGFQ